MGAIALGTFAATAQGLPTPAGLPAPAVQSGVQVATAQEDLLNGAECRVYRLGFAHPAFVTSRSRWPEEARMMTELLRDNPKGIISRYDDGVEFDGKKMGNSVEWNVVTWKGFLTSPHDAKITFMSNGDETYIIRINGTEWKGTGQQAREVSLAKGRNVVEIAMTRKSRNGSLSISYRVSEFGKYQKFSPRNLFHEEREEKDFKLGAW